MSQAETPKNTLGGRGTKEAQAPSTLNSNFADENILKIHAKPLPNPHTAKTLPDPRAHSTEKKEQTLKNEQAVHKADQINSLIQDNIKNSAQKDQKEGFLHYVGRFISSFRDNPEKKQLREKETFWNDAKDLKYANDTLLEAIKVKNELLDAKIKEFNKPHDPTLKSEIRQQIESIETSLTEYVESLNLLNQTTWADNINSNIEIESMNQKTIQEVEKRLQISDLPEIEFKNFNLEAKLMVHNSGFEQNRSKLNKLEGEAQKRIDSKISSIIKNEANKPTESTKASAATVTQLQNQLSALKKLVAEDPKLTNNLISLEKHINQKGNLSADDVKQISTAAKMIEGAALHKMEMNALHKKASEPKGQSLHFNNKLLDPPGDSELQKAFLTTYRGKAINKLTNSTPSKQGLSNEEIEQIPDSEKLFIYINDLFNEKDTNLYQKQQLINLVQKWVDDPFIHSGDIQNPKIQEQIRELAELASASNLPTLSALGKQLKAALNEANYIAPRAEFQNGTTSIQEIISAIATGTIKPGSEEYKNAVRDFAGSLTAQTTSILTSITSSEFKNGEWAVNDYETVKDPVTGKPIPNPLLGKAAPNISRISTNANSLSHFVETSIIAPKGKLDQNEQGEWQTQSERAYDFFVNVQQELISPENEVVNLNDAVSILNGLNTVRMNELIPAETKEKIESSKALFDPTQNYNTLREYTKNLKNNNQAFIPHVKLALMDYHLIEQNQSPTNFRQFVDSNNVKKREELGLNSEKLMMLEPLTNSICNIPQNGQAKHNLNEINQLRSELNDKDVKNLYLQSRPDIDAIKYESIGSKKPMAAEGIAKVGGTYAEAHAIECCDYAYSNPNTGVLGTFDAGGHNNKELFNHQIPVFKAFFDELSNKVKDKEFKSVQEAEAFLKAHVEIYEKKFLEFHKNESGQKGFYGYEYSGPAFFCGMLVNVDGKKHLVQAQMDDCCLCVKKKNTNELTFNPIDKSINGKGLGTPNTKGVLIPSKISSIEVEEGDELFVYSDGIGDFITKSEFTQVINDNHDRADLLQDFNNKIQSFTSDEGRELSSPSREKVSFPPHLLSKKDDDISLAYMRV